MDKKKKPALPAEIIGQMFGFIQDLGTLSTCTRISKIWGKEATRILWGSRDKPQDRATALLAIGDFRRRQSLATNIVSLDFKSYVPDYRFYRSDHTIYDSNHRPREVQYPMLEEVSLVLFPRMDGPNEECYLQYLQPTLRSIVLYSSTCFCGYEPGLALEKLNAWASPSKYLLDEIQVSRTYSMMRFHSLVLTEVVSLTVLASLFRSEKYQSSIAE